MVYLIRYIKIILSSIFAFSVGCMFSMAFTNIELPNNKNTRSNYDIIVLIVTGPDNLLERNTIRQTWLTLKNNIDFDFFNITRQYMDVPSYNNEGFLTIDSIETQKNRLYFFNNKYKKNKNIKTNNEESSLTIKHLFAVGLGKLPAEQLSNVILENKKYNDLLLLPNFKDSYSELTEKIAQSFTMLTQKFDFKYLIKCDDDAFLMLNLIAEELHAYEKNLQEKYTYLSNVPTPELYWGFFNGAARVKTVGPWTETNFHLCDRYLPYAVGGAYVLSGGLVKYISNNAAILGKYRSEDVSIGSWLAPLRNVHRRHDVRFDTEWMPRVQSKDHIVLHKQNPKQMKQIWIELENFTKVKNVDNKSNLGGYFYNWNQVPSKCCIRDVNIP